MQIIEKTNERFEGVHDNFHFVLWVDGNDSKGQWFIRIFDEALGTVAIEGYWAESNRKSVDGAIKFACGELERRHN